ncbi:MAG: hypothetical protein AAF962_19000 [Actinomycetota bacterium]
MKLLEEIDIQRTRVLVAQGHLQEILPVAGTSEALDEPAVEAALTAAQSERHRLAELRQCAEDQRSQVVGDTVRSLLDLCDDALSELDESMRRMTEGLTGITCDHRERIRAIETAVIADFDRITSGGAAEASKPFWKRLLFFLPD